MEEFDAYADNYKQILDKALELSGEKAEYFAQYKARYVKEFAGMSFSGRVLDFGCGIGLLSGCLKQQIPLARIDGFDPSSRSIARVPQDLVAQGTFTHELGTLTGSYDLVVVANVFHHIEKPQRQKTVDTLKSLLVPGGNLIIFEHNPLNPLTRMAVRECPFDEGVVLLTPSELGGYFIQSGLKKIIRDYIVFFPCFLAALRPLEPWGRWCPLGAQFTMVARKEGI